MVVPGSRFISRRNFLRIIRYNYQKNPSLCLRFGCRIPLVSVCENKVFRTAVKGAFFRISIES